MINTTLFIREAKASYKMILIFLAVLSLYASMIVTMFDPELGESLKMMAESMPEIFAAVGMTAVNATLIEFLASYLYGFIFIVFPMVFIILLSNRLIARYIDRGSMVYLVATPNKRIKIAFTQALFLMVSSFVLVIYVTILCIMISNIMFPGDLDVSQFLVLNIGLYGLYIFLGGLCFCSSCVFNDTKFSYGVGAGLCIAFVLIKMISQVSEKSENLKYATPLTLFEPAGIVAGDRSAYVSFIVLYLVGILLYCVGIAVFRKKDLSI